MRALSKDAKNFVGNGDAVASKRHAGSVVLGLTVTQEAHQAIREEKRGSRGRHLEYLYILFI